MDGQRWLYCFVIHELFSPSLIRRDQSHIDNIIESIQSLYVS